MPLRLKTDPTIARLAADLKLRGSTDPSAAIVRDCHKKIQSFLAEYPCQTLTQLLNTATAKLDTVFVKIHNDEELCAVEREYLQRGEVAFVDLAKQFGPDVYAITFGLNHPQRLDRKFVSLIDCRGDKRYRAYFSKWHELAHLLTLTPQIRLRFCRTHAEPTQKDPEEALMDVIAGEIGFLPALVAKHAYGRITLEKIENLREELCPEASRQASVIGFVKAWPRPCLLVQARLATRKAHQRQDDGFDFHTPPSMALRAVKVTINEAARLKGILIPSNMRVPERSVIHRVFADGKSLEAVEDLSWWESQGTARPALQVHVEARSHHDYVETLITT